MRDIIVRPNFADMCELFGQNDFDPKYPIKDLLDEQSDLVKYKLVLSDSDWWAYRSLFSGKKYRLSNEVLFDLYFIYLRMQSNLRLWGKVVDHNKMFTQTDILMRAELSSTDLNDLGRKNLLRSYHYAIWIKRLFPWLRKKLPALNQKDIRIIITLLFMEADFDEFELLFPKWYLKNEHGHRMCFMNIGFLDYLDNRMKRIFQEAFKDIYLESIKNFLEHLKYNPHVSVDDEIVPDKVRRNLEIYGDETRPFTTDELKRFVKKYSRYREYFQKFGLWPEQYETRKRKSLQRIDPIFDYLNSKDSMTNYLNSLEGVMRRKQA